MMKDSIDPAIVLRASEANASHLRNDLMAAEKREELSPPSNGELADRLAEASRLLSAQGANPFRSGAYQRAAETVRAHSIPLWRLYEGGGIAALEQLPGVGRTISRALQQMIRGGDWPLLERLRGSRVAERAFASVPGIGPQLARRIHDELQIETLAELQAAAWDGSLARLEGFGEKRLRGVRESLAARGRIPAAAREQGSVAYPAARDDNDLESEIPVSEILAVDRRYREMAASDQLPRVAPYRNNPTHAAWLPILHTDLGGHHYTALFSNTERAHQMGTTSDWVVIYLENHNGRGQHGRWTVITSRFGPLSGKRIVRGRESDCAAYYAESTSNA